MFTRNWAYIQTGATFEALVTTIVSFEDSRAALFGRPGKDGGQDVRSGDGTLVYQAKYHGQNSAAHARRDAKSEAEKIRKYQEPNHSCYQQWKSVTKWRLVTNATFNPSDQQKWDDEVKSLFKELGLEADYWGLAKLDSLLVKHPEIDSSFFSGNIRAFLTLREIRETILKQEAFLSRAHLGDYFGRTSELTKLCEFLNSDKVFCLISGAGGTGKTRLMLEFGESIAGDWQVLWANIETMKASSSWYRTIIPERPTVLLVDEPKDKQVLQLLIEQLSTRIATWKVVVAVRSTNDPVVHYLNTSQFRMNKEVVTLERLTHAQAQAMCRDLLSMSSLENISAKVIDKVSQKIAENFTRFPVWITLAVHLFEKYKDISKVPETSKDLANGYLDEMVKLHLPEQKENVISLLRWIALLGPINREDDSVAQMISENTKMEGCAEVRGLIKQLIDRRVLVERGANNRLIEVKPDVIRDRILINWLTVETGKDTFEPLSTVKRLLETVLTDVDSGYFTPSSKSIMSSLARMEFLLSSQSTSVGIFELLLKDIDNKLECISLHYCKAVTNVLVHVAQFQPMKTLKLITTIRNIITKTIIENEADYIQGGLYDTLLSELVWVTYHTAFGAKTGEQRKRVFDELYELQKVEVEIEEAATNGLRSSEKRVKDIIKLLIYGGRELLGDYEEAAKTAVVNLLDEISENRYNISSIKALLESIVEPILELTRKKNEYKNNKFWISEYTIPLSSPAWETRELITDKLKSLLADEDIPEQIRIELWKTLIKSHENAFHARKPDDEYRQLINKQTLDDFKWAYSVLKNRTEEIEELKAARKLWEWNLTCSRDSEIVEASKKLENLYFTNDTLQELSPLVDYRNHEHIEVHSKNIAKTLVEKGKAQAITSFLKRAERYFESNNFLSNISLVARELGRRATNSSSVVEFIRNSLSEENLSDTFTFAASCATWWLKNVRSEQGEKVVLDLLKELVDSCGSNEQIVRLLQIAYGNLPLLDMEKITPVEIDYLRSSFEVFRSNNSVPAYIACTAWGIQYNWSELKNNLNQTIEETDEKEIALAIRILVEALHWGLTKNDLEFTQHFNLRSWLLDQLLRVPSLDDLENNFNWKTKEVLKLVGYADVPWLANALEQRFEMEDKQGYERVRALGIQINLCEYVEPITIKTASNPNVVSAVDKLLHLVLYTGMMGFYLPSIFKDIDPEGLLVPDAIGRRINNQLEKREMLRLVRIAGAYSVGSEIWRRIAIAVLRASNERGEDFLKSIYSNLNDEGMRGWGSAIGEVPEIFIKAVENAKQWLDNETDEVLLPFWRWLLEISKVKLNREKEKAKEERGE